MHHSPPFGWRWAAVTALSLALAACGGSDSDDASPDSPTPVPEQPAPPSAPVPKFTYTPDPDVCAWMQAHVPPFEWPADRVGPRNWPEVAPIVTYAHPVRNEQGVPRYGVEDACGLLGLAPHEKYATTTERVWNATRAYIPAERLREQREHLGWHLLTNYVVRNADCHAKNIALYYTSRDDVAFTPIYDVVTTQAYPRFAGSPPGLSVGGRQVWAPGRTLETFFNARLSISPRQYTAMVEQLCESAVAVGKEVIEAAKNEPAWRDVAKQMVHAWNDGMESLRSARSAPQFRGLEVAITEAGFSGPRAPESGRVQIGRSELLAPRKR